MKFRHAGIVSSDIDASIDFYKNLLGFEIQKDLLETGLFVNQICGLKDMEVRTVKMSLGGEVCLELLDFKKNKSSCDSKKITEIGYTHIALTVDNIEEIYKLLSSHGVEFTTSPLISPDKKAKVTFCQDPDGNLIELVEEL